MTIRGTETIVFKAFKQAIMGAPIIVVFGLASRASHSSPTTSLITSANTIVQELSDLFYCESVDASRQLLQKSLIHDGGVNYIWSDAWTAYTTQDPVAAQDAAVFIKQT